MADIVVGIGTSHSPLLNSPAEDYPKHAAIDASGRKRLDKNGKPCTYGELLAQADPSIKSQIEPQVLEERSARCTAEALCAIPLEKLNSGSSEIRNWITAAGAAAHLKNAWQEYIPCYRSAAGTGCGMGFTVWK